MTTTRSVNWLAIVIILGGLLIAVSGCVVTCYFIFWPEQTPDTARSEREAYVKNYGDFSVEIHAGWNTGEPFKEHDVALVYVNGDRELNADAVIEIAQRKYPPNIPKHLSGESNADLMAKHMIENMPGFGMIETSDVTMNFHGSKAYTAVVGSGVLPNPYLLMAIAKNGKVYFISIFPQPMKDVDSFAIANQIRQGWKWTNK